MPDNLSAKDRRRTMRAIKSKRTGPERKIHGLLAGRKIQGWTTNSQNLPGQPDFIFENEKLVIFVDGCFWHGCEVCKKPLPETNRDYWERKINRNKERDIENNKSLKRRGWVVLRIWEHELKGDNWSENIYHQISNVLFK